MTLDFSIAEELYMVGGVSAVKGRPIVILARRKSTAASVTRGLGVMKH
jgi:hypothetical protein